MRALALALASLVAACSDRIPAPEPPPAPRAQPLARDGTSGREVTSVPDRVKVQLDLAAVRAALRAYREEHAAWPGAIGDLKLDGLSYPADLAYDPASGVVTSRTYPTF
jgi:hypothetical protein